MTEDDKKLRKDLKDSDEEEDFPVPIYMGPVEDTRPKPGEVHLPFEPSAIERDVEKMIALDLACKYCEELPVGIDSDGRVEMGCVEGCPHEGGEMYPHAWIRTNRKDRDDV